MALSLWEQRFFDSTRGRIVALLRRESCTVDELAQSLELTDNAVRAHLATLERDGIVRQDGQRRGGGKPSYTYALTPDARTSFSRAYLPLLSGLMDELTRRMSEPDLEAVMHAVGKRLAERVKAATGDQRARVEQAAAFLGELGGLVEVDEGPDGYVLRGVGACPLGEVVGEHPPMCHAVQTLLGELVGTPVRECCDRSGTSPSCRFLVARQAQQS